MRSANSVQSQRVVKRVPISQLNVFFLKKLLTVFVLGKSQLSAGWDRRILIWCLENGELEDLFCNTALKKDQQGSDENDDECQEELACDGVIIDMEYCPKR